MSRKTEHRTEYRDVAQQLDAIALPLVDELGLAEAYRVAAEQLPQDAHPQST